MTTPSVKLIFASNNKGVIGRDNSLPWSVPEDLLLFKQKTLYQTVIMGRRTFESLPSSIKPMPNRTNVVVSRDKTLKIKGVKTTSDVEGYIHSCKEPVWVIGGSELYRSVQHLCDEVHHTHIYDDSDGDAHFHFDYTGWDLKEDSGDLISKTGTGYRVRVWSVPLMLFRFS